MTLYAVLSIGCVECGDENEEALVGIYSRKGLAKRKYDELRASAQSTLEENHRRGYTHAHINDSEHGFSTGEWQVRLLPAELDA